MIEILRFEDFTTWEKLMKRLVTILKTSAAASAMLLAFGSTAHAQTWTGLGADDEYSTPENWSTDTFPSTDAVPNNNSTQDINGEFTVERSLDTDVLGAVGDPLAEPPTEDVVGNSPGRTFVRGGAVLNITGGSHQDHRSGANIFNFVGGGGGTGVVNQSGGDVGIGHGLRIAVGGADNGTYNLTGGNLVISRGSNNQSGGPEAANLLGRPSMEIAFFTEGQVGLFEMSGSTSLATRGPVYINQFGIFSVLGSGHLPSSAGPEIGIGSNGSGDGGWIQQNGATLRVGLDSGGVTPIFIDEVGEDGGGDVIFRAGAELDPFDAGGANNAVTTVMTWEGTLTNDGLVLSDAAAAAGWVMTISGNELQVSNPNLPDAPLTELGDFDGDGDVDLVDLDRYNQNIGAAAVGSLADLDLDGDGTVDANDFLTHYTTLVETSNGQKGTFLGDINLDGTVNVLGDAFALVGNLNNPATSWSQGDLNADGTTNVLGDAFALIGNLGNSNAP